MELTRREFLRNLGLAAGSMSVMGLSACTAPAAMAAPADGAAKPGEYALPPLPYDYDALEPHLDKQTLTLHHDKHHAGYVRGLNGALAKLAAAREGGDPGVVPGLTKALAFHGSGHVFHCLYWASMKPNGGGRPGGDLAKHIDRDFGSYDAFVAHFGTVTKKVNASGWGVLALEPMQNRLVVLGAEKHENVLFAGTVPLMICDVWEHAYYLKYQNNRGAYVDAFLKNLVDWSAVGKRLAAAMG
jgi:Fe-Mn family superoxide dismutase